MVHYMHIEDQLRLNRGAVNSFLCGGSGRKLQIIAISAARKKGSVFTK